MRDWFTEWMTDDSFTVPDDSDPYNELPTITIDGVELDVAEGTGAMRAYQDMLYGMARHDAAKVRTSRRRWLNRRRPEKRSTQDFC
jgi:hypothetical protein